MSDQRTPGRFIWRELSTTDIDGAVRFYSEVFGWRIEPNAMGTFVYWVLHAGDRQVGGLYEAPKGSPQVPFWHSYVSVDDVDAAAHRAQEIGATALSEPHDLPNVGRMVLMRDPQGAMFSLFRDFKADPKPRQPQVGEFCWEQLNTGDPAAARAFYAQVTGWSLVSFPGSGMEVFTADGGKTQIASMMRAPPGAPAHWLTYVVVDTLDAAKARVTRGGGKVLVDRIELPAVGAISVVNDPQGAMIALFELPRG